MLRPLFGRFSSCFSLEIEGDFSNEVLLYVGTPNASCQELIIDFTLDLVNKFNIVILPVPLAD